MARHPMYLQPAKDYLAEHGETKAQDLADALKISPATLVSGIRTAVARGELFKRNQGRHVFYRLPVEGEDPEARPLPAFNAALWADGDLVLVGVELNADGHSLTLGPDRVDMLRRLLGGA